MKIIPEGRKLIVLPKEGPVEDDTVNGVIIPYSVATADLKEATVVEVSDDLSHKFAAGDIVLHPKDSGLGCLYKGKPHLWLRQDQNEIWGKVEPDEK